MEFDPQKNYYDILGVDENASEDEIKKAYRKLAMEHHPDRGGSKEKFQEINEAKDVLTDRQKKQKYDAFRKGGGGFGGMGGGGMGGGRGGFSMGGGQVDLGDVFSQFFGGGQGGMGGSRGARGQRRNKRKRSSRKRGNDLQMKLRVDLEDIYKGAKKKVSYKRLNKCSRCDGSGTEEGSSKETCGVCNGKGVQEKVVKTPFGRMKQQTRCTNCGGDGKINSNPCNKCSGSGLEKTKETLEVEIPAGVKSGSMLKYQGKGNYGKQGGQPGDFYVKILMKSSDKYERKGNDLHVNLEVDLYTAVLGGKVQVDHPEGEVTVKIPKGIQPDDKIKVSGKGFVDRKSTWDSKGNMIIHPKIQIPKKLSKEDRKLWEKLKENNS